MYVMYVPGNQPKTQVLLPNTAANVCNRNTSLRVCGKGSYKLNCQIELLKKFLVFSFHRLNLILNSGAQFFQSLKHFTMSTFLLNLPTLELDMASQDLA